MVSTPEQSGQSQLNADYRHGLLYVHSDPAVVPIKQMLLEGRFGQPPGQFGSQSWDSTAASAVPARSGSWPSSTNTLMWTSNENSPWRTGREFLRL